MKKRQFSYTLEDLAQRLGARLVGDPAVRVTGLSTLVDAEPGDIAFLANRAYLKYLGETAATAVLLHESHLEECKGNALVLDNPYLAYAELSRLFDPLAVEPQASVHASAVIDETAPLGANVEVGPQVVIGPGVSIGDNTRIHAGCVIGADSMLGEGCLLHPNVTLYHGVVIGARAVLHSSCVIGADGFGFAHDGKGWHKIAQLGGVLIGDDVEVGSCTSIDRGALGDTIIGNDVKIDSQVQIAHNVQIGDHSALAGCVGIAGSTKVGRYCLMGGGVGLAGHLEIADGVQVTGMSLVTNSITKPGVYSSGTGAMDNGLWRRNAVRFKQLDQLARRLNQVEKSLKDK